MYNEKIFKAYDIRGVYPEEINEEVAEKIAESFVKLYQPKTIAVGRDVRLSSQSLQDVLMKTFLKLGVEVFDIGLGPTDMIYFAVGAWKLDAGIQVTASHNPAEYGGMKIVRSEFKPVEIATLKELCRSVLTEEKDGGEIIDRPAKDEYVKHLSGLVDLKDIRPLRVVANNNFGVTGPVAQDVINNLDLKQIELIGLNFEPNGNFPKGRPDPLVPENRGEVTELVQKEKADFAVAWDADGDRCYVADENGLFLEGCHFTALLAAHLLKKNPGGKVIHERRNIWAIEDAVKDSGGVPVVNKTGHIFIKSRMRQEDAVFGGEMSGHMYFKELFYADSGILAFLYFLEIIKDSGGKKVSEIVAPLRESNFVSGEINFKVQDADKTKKDIEAKYQDGKIDKEDGLSVSYDDWRFNLRSSDTEPLLRLNVEGRNQAIVEQKTKELTDLINS